MYSPPGSLSILIDLGGALLRSWLKSWVEDFTLEARPAFLLLFADSCVYSYAFFTLLITTNLVPPRIGYPNNMIEYFVQG